MRPFGHPVTHSSRGSQSLGAPCPRWPWPSSAATSVVVGPVAQILPTTTASAAGSFVDPHFADFEVWTGLDHPTTVRFASDGRAFVAEKSGVIWEYDSVDSSSPTRSSTSTTRCSTSGIAAC